MKTLLLLLAIFIGCCENTSHNKQGINPEEFLSQMKPGQYLDISTLDKSINYQLLEANKKTINYTFYCYKYDKYYVVIENDTITSIYHQEK